MTFRAVVLRAAGTNCDGETVAALEAAGARAERVHVNRLLGDASILDDIELLVFPGGFTFGDDISAAAVLAFTLKKQLLPQLNAFVDSGRLVLGICNGFQVLVRLGLLPGRSGHVGLLPNHSGRFENRWVRMRSGSTPGPWLEPDVDYFFPVAHAEGRLEWFPAESGAPFPEAQIALRYVGDETPVRYPENPNGSFLDIAGITNSVGNVLGLMPHPERFIRPVHHPAWTRFRRPDGSPPRESDLPVPLGLALFRRVVQESR